MEKLFFSNLDIIFSDKVKNKMNKQGFTLIELVTVVAIISILVGLAFPSLHKFISDAAIKSVAFDIMAGLRGARSQAISKGSIVTVTVSPGNHKLTVGTTDISLSDNINFEAKVNIGDPYAGADVSIDFYPNGACESTLYIQVNSDPNLCVKIESRISGLARI